MLTFDEALRHILNGAEPTETERVAVGLAEGRVLAQPLLARAPLPANDHSAMDGYAVHSQSFDGNGPWELPVVGESRPGADAPELVPQTVCRIFTGAALPRGADSVVMQEDVERESDVARFRQLPAAGSHVRRCGEDIDVGAVALEAGTRMGPGQLGLAAALDWPDIPVARRPRVAILCTGDELRAPGDPVRPGSIPESNSVALAAMARRAGGEVTILPFARDDRAAVAVALREAVAASDILVTVGGVSVGDHDVVRPALEAAGATLEFWQVKIRPGKPLAFGRAGRTRLLGLPGNPVSAQITFALFGVPLLRASQGDQRPLPSRRRARLATPLAHKRGRQSFLRGQLESDVVSVLLNQAPGAQTSMAWANCFVVVPAESRGYSAGAEVELLAFADL